MHLSENEGIEGNTFLVTGGLGFVGAALCLELVRRGARQVRSLDLRTTSPWSDHLRKSGVHCIKGRNFMLIGDVIRKKDVERASRGADCVFHLASYGMSGKEMLQYGRVDEVNINGTFHVLEACFEHEIRRLVYVSTYNVVFGGKEIVNGNETLPYFPLDAHVDSYGRSKSIAEQLVLKSNGRPFKEKKGKCLYTCAVRPAAIFGPGEERHLPRIIHLAQLGLVPFRIGEVSVLTDWVYVDNLVLALILASMGLLDDIPGKEGKPVAAGQPYFISDGSPVNIFEFLRPLLRSLEYDMPKASLAVPHALLLGKFFSAVGVTHYFSPLKAKQELGSIPILSPQEGMAKTISYWQERKRRALDGPTICEWLFSVLGMGVLFCAAYLPDIGPVPLFRALPLFFLRSLWAVRVLFLLCAAAHVGEAIYAWRLAKRVDPANARGWFWQTFALGMFSLRFLLKIKRAAK
ncbi:hypothetical protein RJ639_022101 [Escallonia herrerae]|uniref:3-beta hydroxysteroid dehydrogenase/isomerase domain-containing protein n=1 Tax=Escallonia herrerae TaxID=1293975 RepID=A0AA89AI65_9ASTE|nr:hypothetical protein RJ639_022101 [Escallonia herrerae]